MLVLYFLAAFVRIGSASDCGEYNGRAAALCADKCGVNARSWLA